MRRRPALPGFHPGRPSGFASGILAVSLAVSALTAGLPAAPALAATGPKAATTAAPTTTAVTRPEPRALSPLGANTAASDQADVQSGRLPAAHVRPLSPQLPQTSSSSKAVRPPQATKDAAAASCTPADFGTRTGSELVAYIKDSTTDCINTLFGITGTGARNVFREAQMVTVADAFQDASQTYPGDNSTHVWQLVLFLRAGYYVQYNDSADVGDYGPALAAATECGLDAFTANSHFMDVSSEHGSVLGDVIILTDSANEQARYLDTYTRVLNAYDSSYDAYWSMDTAVNDVFTPLFRGHFNPAFISAVTADPSIIDTLNSFTLNHLPMLSGTWYFMASNAGMETARFLDTAGLKDKVRPMVKGLLGASSITGPTAALWVGAAEMTSAHDAAQCSYYDTCDLTSKLTAAALPLTYKCDDGHTFLAQSLTGPALAEACKSVQGQDAYFHGMVKDSGPVADDHNTNIQIVVFASPRDYRTYSGWIFGNSTDNGGEYLEGNPADPDNQARFVAYVKSVGDGFPADIWNLNHEYTHYLDGRYDTYGDFSAGQTVPDIWWIEGFAEYVSYSYRGVPDTEALFDAGKHTYALSTLWQSTYANSDLTRTYPWGYLAVRYMVENHPDDVQAMLTKFRTGDYAGAYAVYNTGIATRYDADFAAWLDTCAAGACRGSSSRPGADG
ncbi:collagenase [Streptomyces olivochromogenes]|uniref:collagenase n=1 Tax=Streptomyces olivochromogenes TaxID=1963 RepID=UPI0036D9B2EB